MWKYWLLRYFVYSMIKNNVWFFVSDITIQYDDGAWNFKSFRILNENTLCNILVALWKQLRRQNGLGKMAMEIAGMSTCSYSSLSCIFQEKRQTFRSVKLGMPTTRIKLFNGKASSSELFFEKRDALGFPIHFACPSVDKSKGWFTSVVAASISLLLPLSFASNTGNITGSAGCARESSWNIFGQLGNSNLDAISNQKFKRILERDKKCKHFGKFLHCVILSHNIRFQFFV